MSLGFEIFTLFPGAVEAFLRAGLMGKAIDAGHIDVHTTNFRDYARDRHRTVDDTPYGGGAGMLLKPEPVVAALEDVAHKRGPMHTVMLTPAAPTFDQRAARRLAQHARIGLLCGRYEGFDDRLRTCVDECFSIGDFVLNGGEVAALVIIEAVARLREGVLGNPESIEHESFSSTTGDDRWLEPPHYTRPVVFRGIEVPTVLQGGNHRAIEHHRRVASWQRTWSLRPQLRPRRGLAAGQPLYCVCPDVVADTIIGQGIQPIVGAPEPKQVRKQLKRRHGRAPRWIGLAAWGNDHARHASGETVARTSRDPAQQMHPDLNRRGGHEQAGVVRPDSTGARPESSAMRGEPGSAGSTFALSGDLPASDMPTAVLDLLAATGPLDGQTPLVFVLDPVIISAITNEGNLTPLPGPESMASNRGWPGPVEAVILPPADAGRLTTGELAQSFGITESSQPRVPSEWINCILSRVLTPLRQP